MKASVYLMSAVMLGLAGSIMLKASNAFTVLIPSLVFVICYSLAFYNFSIALKTIPLFLGYAIWSALSTIGNFLLGVYLFNEDFSIMKIVAIMFIVLGTVLIQKKESIPLNS